MAIVYKVIAIFFYILTSLCKENLISFTEENRYGKKNHYKYVRAKDQLAEGEGFEPPCYNKL